MKVYYKGNDRADHTAIICPAADPRGIAAGIASEWVGDGGSPLQIPVHFRGGEASVPDSVGKYLIAVGIAKRTRLILPGIAA